MVVLFPFIVSVAPMVLFGVAGQTLLCPAWLEPVIPLHRLQGAGLRAVPPCPAYNVLLSQTILCSNLSWDLFHREVIKRWCWISKCLCASRVPFWYFLVYFHIVRDQTLHRWVWWPRIWFTLEGEPATDCRPTKPINLMVFLLASYTF